MKLSVIFWNIYYFFKPVKNQLGKTEHVRMVARTSGLKVKEIIKITNNVGL